MNNLTIITHNGQKTIDSREVAEMIDMQHKDLLEKIRGYLPHLTSGKFRPLEFFIESTYQDAKGEERPSYLLTRKGCDMVANKLTGEKGVLFSAAYINKFHEMEQAQIPRSLPEALRMAADLAEKTELLLLENAQSKQIICELQPKASYYDTILHNKSLMPISQIAKDYGMSAIKMNELLHELGVQFKQGDIWLLYQKHASQGYTQSKTHVIDAERSKLHTNWTQKGRLFIYDLLKNQKGILPLIEREKAG
jgi:Rha family phage regulatory protein